MLSLVECSSSNSSGMATSTISKAASNVSQNQNQTKNDNSYPAL
jgi:hypothetical protein